jgi:hypothetical protein
MRLAKQALPMNEGKQVKHVQETKSLQGYKPYSSGIAWASKSLFGSSKKHQEDVRRRAVATGNVVG